MTGLKRLAICNDYELPFEKRTDDGQLWVDGLVTLCLHFCLLDFDCTAENRANEEVVSNSSDRRVQVTALYTCVCDRIAFAC